MVHVQIASFDGPLDLLLQLISKAKIDIKDIFVSEITDQYLQIVHSMETLDLENVSDFLTMAATLLQIKSRSLLPKPEEDIEIEEEKQRLIQNLYEYRRLKDAAEELNAMASRAESNYYRLPDEYVSTENEVVLDKVSVDELLTVLVELLAEKDAKAEESISPSTVVRPINIPLNKAIADLRTKLSRKKRILFRELFKSWKQRYEIIVYFLGMLELIANGEISALQESAFDEIVLVWREKAEEKNS